METWWSGRNQQDMVSPRYKLYRKDGEKSLDGGVLCISKRRPNGLL